MSSHQKLIDAVWAAMDDPTDPLSAEEVRDAVEQAIEEHED